MDSPIYTRRQTAEQVPFDGDSLGIDVHNVQQAVEYAISHSGPVVVGGNGPVRIEQRVLTEQEAAACAITLAALPIDPQAVAFDIMGGVPQMLGMDFLVVGAQLRWLGGDLAGLLTAGDVVRVVYTAVPEFKIVYLTVTQAMIETRNFALPVRASYPDQLCLDIIGGVAQGNGIDFSCDGLNVQWFGMGLETLLEVGDHIRIAFLG